MKVTDGLGPYELNTIITGDARILAGDIPDNSVDLIFTDPVYQNIDDYRWLAETAARVLKPDSVCLAFCGIGYLPETVDALRQGGLTYHWQLVMYLPTMNQRGAYRTFSNWRALLWFDKGKAKPLKHIRDLLVDRATSKLPDPRNHRWTKNADTIAYYLEAFTEPLAVTLDPNCGGGTVPAVCKMLGRNYVAFEIDPEVAGLARQRVANTQPPLFVLKAEQLGLEIEL